MISLKQAGGDISISTAQFLKKNNCTKNVDATVRLCNKFDQRYD